MEAAIAVIAHSFESRQDGRLVGAFYGVSIGPCFFGESMFATVPDASKCAFATFARRMFETIERDGRTMKRFEPVEDS